MASVKTQRGAVRGAFTKTLNEINIEIVKVEPDKVTLRQLFKRLEGHHVKLESLDDRIMDAAAAESEEEFETEYVSVTEYRDKFTDMEIRVNLVLSDGLEDYESASTGVDKTSGNRKCKYRLPKLEFKKFNGEPREWLGFWSQFKSIHENPEMTDEVKFQYLVQATIENSKAREVIESFPPTAENYPKVIEYMKNRFGRDDLLVEVYVRDLLHLVLNNTNQKEKASVATLYDKLETQLRALETLGVASDNYAAMLYPLVESSIPEDILRTWERTRNQPGQDETKSRLVRLMEFLRTEVDSELRIKMAQTSFHNTEKVEKSQKGKSTSEKKYESIPTAHDLFSSEGRTEHKPKICLFCDKGHDTSECFLGAKMTLEEKNKAIREKKGCYFCLKTGHFSKQCKSKHICTRRHFVIMCPELPKHQRKTSSEVPKNKEEKDPTLANHYLGGTLLQTIIVRLKNGKEERLVRALIDTGSQNSYITEKAASVLNFKPVGETKIAHCLFGGKETQQQVHRMYEVSVISKDRKFECRMNVLDEPKICGTIARVNCGPWVQELKEAGIEVTDLESDITDIHLLIGSDIGPTLMTGRIHPTSTGPVAIETKLGWTVSGKCMNMKSTADSSLLVTTLHVTDANIQDLWRLDAIGIHDPVESHSQDELTEAATEHFLKTITVNPEGRYEVSLPRIEGHPPVSDNRRMAERRLISSVKKLEELNKVEYYEKIFQEWLDLGVIERALPSRETKGCYLPHRPVFKPSSLTTPIRPVFDASAKSENRPSLNDCLEKGKNLIELVPTVLTRFRMKRFGIVADIKKAFLQISVRETDRDFLRFLRWENGGFQEYRHCRVVFGVSSSPFLLASTINYHLDRSEQFKQTAQLLKRSFYVDNCIASLDGENEVKLFMKESIELMSRAKFELRGWVSNLKGNSFCETQDVVPVLGLCWNLNTDMLFLDLHESLKEKPEPIVTKRNILSAAHRVFDPIGFSCPVTLVPKLLLQEIWKRKLGWDEPVDDAVRKKFEDWTSQLTWLGKIEIPRWITDSVAEECRSLHVFTDASKLAYATCIFMRTECHQEVKVQLVMARSRVATTKKMTIPRLELMGCCIGSRLASTVKEDLEIPSIKTTYWTDSSNCLYWIQKQDNWATFVWNRVNEIRKLTGESDWRHISGELNPADLPSRGCSAKRLFASRWWEGPDWLKLPEDMWPKSSVQYDLEVVLSERRKTVVSHLAVKLESSWCTIYFSKYRKIIRMIAWMLRWKNKIQKKESEFAGPLTVDEEKWGELTLLRMVQAEAFSGEERVIKEIQAKKDSFGILRVHTKIVRREDDINFRFPILLPASHPVVRLLIEQEHLKMNHCGIQVLMGALREKYWIVKSRKVIRQVVTSCGRCRRFTVTNVNPPEAPLPIDRVRDATVFEVTGIDLGGPLYLKNKEKAWFIVFTCAVMRAVHLELVTSLSTEAFLQGLRRFIARRGRPSTIYCDNGTNFEGSRNELEKIDWKKIQDTVAVQPIQWKFNPPSAPWWGGWLERIVGMVKVLLRRILGRASLDYEELQTVLCDCELTINSRPLTYLSEEIDDLVSLTPAMFLNENRNSAVPDLDQLDSSGFNRRFQYRQKLRDDFRRRFRQEYLGSLVHSSRGKSSNIPIKIGDIVLVGSDNKKRIDWPLARVIKLIPGPDGVVRVVKVKTSSGELMRPVQRLYPLEVDGDDRDFCKHVPVTVKEDKVRKPCAPEKIVDHPAQKEHVTRSGRKLKVPLKLRD